MAKRLALILGGARSGKSTFAEQLAARLGSRVLFVATATAGDDEMAERIAAHRRSRPINWRTTEEPMAVAEAIARDAGDSDVVLVDCLTLWISNLMLAGEGQTTDLQCEASIMAQVAKLIEVYRGGEASFVIIANEVGLGLVPPYPSARLYRDLLGKANQLLAAAADEAYFMVAGLPLPLKELSKHSCLEG